LTCFGVILGSILDGFDPFSGRTCIVASEITVSTGSITTGGGSVIGPGSIANNYTLNFFDWSVIMALIKCPECNTEISDRAEKCIKCGFPMAKYVPPVKCPECGNEAPGGAVTCGKCGFPLKERGGAPSVIPDTAIVAGSSGNDLALQPRNESDVGQEVAQFKSENEDNFASLSDTTKKKYGYAITACVGIAVLIAILILLSILRDEKAHPKAAASTSQTPSGGGSKTVTAPKAAASTNQASRGGGSNTFTDSRDKKTYRTVVIGGKRWMVENLNYATASGSWCYGNDNSNCGKYGRLYDWNTALTACPSGYHLPSRQEWDGLVTAAAVGGYYWNAKRFKARSGWNSISSGGDGNGIDEYGFSALPGGNRRTNGNFENIGVLGIWWTATENWSTGRDDVAYNRRISNKSDYVVEYSNDKSNGYSVRCVGD